MLRQLLSSSDNGQSMVIYPLRYEPCSSCHRCCHIVTTVRAWLYIPKVSTMLRQLLSSHDKGQSMVIYYLRYDKQCLTVVTIRENGSYFRDILPCSDR